jgi:glycosyltransferase involved in cell wall biosynthesis
MHRKASLDALARSIADPRLTAVVPCYNEAETLPAFFAAVIPAMQQATGGNWRLVCVDDGSRDATFAILAAQHQADQRVMGVRLSRNFGHQAAVSTGLAYASGDYIGLMDCDLQDPVEVLVEMFHTAVAEDLDVCYGVRARREAPPLLRAAYSLFYRIIRRVADHDWPRDAGDFCILSARCHRVLLSLPEQSRMLRGLRSWIGLRQKGLRYNRPSRLYGKTKYNVYKLALLAMQGLTAFSSIPLRLASAIGLIMSLGSILLGIVVLINRFFKEFSLFGYWVGANPGTASILVFVSFVFGILFISLGLIGEYMVVLLQEVKRRPTAIVESVVGDLQQQASAYALLQTPETKMRRHEYDQERGRAASLSDASGDRQHGR